jgi:hypothetical protein
MLQITLDSTGRQSSIQSVNPHNWDFKLRVINDGDSTELRITFDETDGQTETNMMNDVISNNGMHDPVIE